ETFRRRKPASAVMPREDAVRVGGALSRFPPEWVVAVLSTRPGSRFIPWSHSAERLDSPMLRQAHREIFDPLVRSLIQEADMSQARRLGRGLEALLSSSASLDAPEGALVSAALAPARAGSLVEVSIYEIDSNPYQPRKDIGE